jgi:hypothetical protein
LRTALDGCEILINLPLTAKIKNPFSETENEDEVYFNIDKEKAFFHLTFGTIGHGAACIYGFGQFPDIKN